MHNVILDFSRPGKLTDNAFIESFNGKFRGERLNTSWFPSLAEAQRKCEAWRGDYNEVRPHSAIDNRACGASSDDPQTRSAGRLMNDLPPDCWTILAGRF
jgi:transposase InsO family protein